MPRRRFRIVASVCVAAGAISLGVCLFAFAGAPVVENARATTCDPANVAIHGGSTWVESTGNATCYGYYSFCIEGYSQSSGSWSAPQYCTYPQAQPGWYETSQVPPCLSGVFYRAAVQYQGNSWIITPTGGRQFC